jgi:hypothetical protein
VGVDYGRGRVAKRGLAITEHKYMGEPRLFKEITKNVGDTLPIPCRDILELKEGGEGEGEMWVQLIQRGFGLQSGGVVMVAVEQSVRGRIRDERTIRTAWS